MKRTKFTGNFILVLLLNLLFNFEWSIPAWILLILHFVIGLPVYWFWIALGLWVLLVVLFTKLLGWTARVSNEKPIKRENKNPYSASDDVFKKKK
ncbi:MAG: hypothetical protein ACI4HO_09545 [Ruminococcus sp.]